MANALALAAVTATLKDLLDDGLMNSSLSALGAVEVTCRPPDQLSVDADRNRLNLYLWKVSQNPAFANERLPSHNASGTRIDAPRLGLDLHFILSAAGTADLNAPILLGYGMQQLHEHPLLTSQDIRNALQTTSPPLTGAILPPAYKLLAAADLADQVERIRIKPTRSEDEDLFKLWPAFNAPLRMSALYTVSLVLIEAKYPLPDGPPVRAFQVQVNSLKRPQLTRVVAQPGPIGAPLDPLVQPTAGSRVMFIGSGLIAPIQKLRVGGIAIDLGAQAQVSGQRISALLPTNLPAGLHAAQLEQFWQAAPGDQRSIERSNALPLLVAPRVTSAAKSGAVAAGKFSGILTVTTTVAVAVAQTARLHLVLAAGGAQLAITARARSVDSAVLEFDLADLPVQDYLWQLDVDGGETPPFVINFGVP